MTALFKSVARILGAETDRQIIKEQMKGVEHPSKKEMKQAWRRFIYLRNISDIFRELSVLQMYRRVQKEGTIRINFDVKTQPSVAQLGIDPGGTGLMVQKNDNDIVYRECSLTFGKFHGERTVSPVAFADVISQEPGVRAFCEQAETIGLEVTVKALPKSSIPADENSHIKSGQVFQLKISRKDPHADFLSEASEGSWISREGDEPDISGSNIQSLEEFRLRREAIRAEKAQMNIPDTSTNVLRFG